MKAIANRRLTDIETLRMARRYDDWAEALQSYVIEHPAMREPVIKLVTMHREREREDGFSRSNLCQAAETLLEQFGVAVLPNHLYPIRTVADFKDVLNALSQTGKLSPRLRHLPHGYGLS